MASKTLTSTLLLLLCLTSSIASANAYRWTDENGQVIYSQQPPPNQNATQIKAPPPPASSAQTEQTSAQKLIDTEKAAEEKAKEQEQAAAIDNITAEEKQVNCLRARQRLTNLQLRNRIKMIGPDGQATMLSEQQKLEEINETKEAIKAYCAGPE